MHDSRCRPIRSPGAFLPRLPHHPKSGSARGASSGWERATGALTGAGTGDLTDMAKDKATDMAKDSRRSRNAAGTPPMELPR
jgi:hypothetical protein